MESPEAIPFLLIFICPEIFFIIEDSTHSYSTFRFKFRRKDCRMNSQMRIRISRNPTAKYGSGEHKISICKMCLLVYGIDNDLPVVESQTILQQSRF